MNINKELKNYIKKYIFPKYTNNDKAHDISHVHHVINRSLELSKNYDVDINMIYTIASFHDLGHSIDKENHENISADIFHNDSMIQTFFSVEQSSIIEDAIRDHRASLHGTPRSIYGKIVSDADRSIDVNLSMRRGYFYSLEHHNDFNDEQHIEDCYHHASSKFGENGYIRFWLNDEKNVKTLEIYRKLLKNKNEYIKRFKIVNNIKE
ncbi:MAG: HD domain-containing protein [Clostridia bacterium]|nr:HD domain-containing protein [Clostridia bacterium]